MNRSDSRCDEPQHRWPSEEYSFGRRCLIRGVWGGLLAVFCAVAGDSRADEGVAPWPFFAFDNGVGRGELGPEQQAQVLAEAGYQGIGYTGVDNIPATLQALQARGLKMYSTYIQINLSEGQPPYEPGLPEAIKQLKGAGTALWLHVHGDQPSATTQDDRAVDVIRAVAAMAQESELPVVLYPHVGFYVATTADALRLARKVDRKNVGASLNLCHFLKQNDAATLKQCVRDARPYLFLVSINGADAGDTRNMGWERLIQTLDRGTFDMGAFLQLLWDEGYRGPIGLQCYAIPGDIRENLARSMKAWKQLTARVTTQ